MNVLVIFFLRIHRTHKTVIIDPILFVFVSRVLKYCKLWLGLSQPIFRAFIILPHCDYVLNECPSQVYEEKRSNIKCVHVVELWGHPLQWHAVIAPAPLSHSPPQGALFSPLHTMQRIAISRCEDRSIQPVADPECRIRGFLILCGGRAINLECVNKATTIDPVYAQANRLLVYYTRCCNMEPVIICQVRVERKTLLWVRTQNLYIDHELRRTHRVTKKGSAPTFDLCCKIHGWYSLSK